MRLSSGDVRAVTQSAGMTPAVVVAVRLRALGMHLRRTGHWGRLTTDGVLSEHNPAPGCRHGTSILRLPAAGGEGEYTQSGP